jgi:predicted ABC-type transport system involved in lysophospholipase L1 biosynthesis ATPase subunit
MAVLMKADNLHKSYAIMHRTVSVLRGVSFSVESGTSVAIVGASGAGKSTLLHILGGLDTPDSGTVIFQGTDLYRCSAGRRSLIRAKHIGFVFQSYHLLPELTVLENAVLPAMTGKGTVSSFSAMKERARELLSRVGLEERAQHRPMELSGGEQQRLALARALMNEPDFLLADEPTGNLDDETGRQVLDYVFDLARERRHTLVVVTHSEQVAERCSRHIRLNEGILADDREQKNVNT